MASNTPWCLDSQHHNVSFPGSFFSGLPPLSVGWSSTLGSSPYLRSSPVLSYTVVHPSASWHTFFWLMLMPSGVSSCPKNLHSFTLNYILSWLNLRLLLQTISSKLRTAMLCLILSSPLANTSSAMPVTPGTVFMTACGLFWKTSGLTDRLKGSHGYMCFPHGVLNIISDELSMSNHTIQKPDLVSIKVKYLDPGSPALGSSMVLI